MARVTPQRTSTTFSPPLSISNLKYTITTPSGSTFTTTTLQGNLQQGDTITANFTTNTPQLITLVSYVAPSSNFSDLTQQVIFSQASSTTTAGKQSLTIKVPNCYFQVDFICGPAIDQFGPTGSNIAYHAQNRYIDGQQGGTQACTNSSISGNICNDTYYQNCGWQASEQDFAGVTVTLTGTTFTGQQVTLTTTTDKYGNYTFANLVASDANGYTITASTPSGYTAEGATSVTFFLNTNTSDTTGNNFCFTATKNTQRWW